MRTFLWVACLFICSVTTAQTAKAHYDRAVEAFDKEDFTTSLRELRLAHQLDSTNPAFYVLRGKLEQRLYSRLYAMDFYEKAIQLDSTYAPAYAARAELYFDDEDYEECLADYAAAIRFNPTHAAVYYVQRGLVFERTYAWPDALLSYKRAIEADTTCAAAYFHRAQRRYEQNPEAAQRDYDLAFRYAPNDSIRTEYRFLCAETKLAPAHFEDAYADYKAVLSTYPDRPQVLGRLAYVCEVLDRNDEALGYLFEMLEMKSYDGDYLDIPHTHGQIALLYRKMGEYRKAIDSYYESARLYRKKAPQYDFEPDYSAIAYCEMKLGEYDAALKHLEQHKWIWGANEYLIRAELYGLTGDRQKACEDIKRAANEYPGDDEEEQIRAFRKKYCD